jgi:hypothetical protein
MGERQFEQVVTLGEEATVSEFCDISNPNELGRREGYTTISIRQILKDGCREPDHLPHIIEHLSFFIWARRKLRI